MYYGSPAERGLYEQRSAETDSYAAVAAARRVTTTYCTFRNLRTTKRVW